MSREMATGTTGDLHHGTIVRLNRTAGFGYVRDREGGAFIFVVEKALTHAQFRKLELGTEVRYRLDARLRVTSVFLV